MARRNRSCKLCGVELRGVTHLWSPRAPREQGRAPVRAWWPSGR
jgi:hypothetical protein